MSIKNLIGFLSIINIIKTTLPPIPEIRKEIISSSLDFQNYYSFISNGAKLERIKTTLKIKYNPEGEERENSIILQAKNLAPYQVFTSYNITLPQKEGNYEIKAVSINLKEGNYQKIGNTLVFSFELKDNEKIEINYSYKYTNNKLYKLYRVENINLPPGNEGYIKISTSDEFYCLGSMNNTFKKSGDNYIFDGKIENGLNDYIHLSYKAGKWKSKIKTSFIKSSEQKIVYAKIIAPKFYKGGNNNINKYNIKHNGKLTEKEKNEFLYENIDEAYFELETEFSNIITKKWENPMEKNPKSTSTKLTDAKVKEIIKEDKSSDPEYIKIGKWVKKNMKYDINYLGKKMSIDEILTSLRGVCEHYTLLYNALLNSINIESIYVSGFGFNGENDFNVEKNRHAWTMAKINNKWIPLDSTWNLFYGELPSSHVVQAFNDSSTQYSYSGKGKYFSNTTLDFLGFDSNYNTNTSHWFRNLIISIFVMAAIASIAYFVFWKFCKAKESDVDYYDNTKYNYDFTAGNPFNKFRN